MTNNSPLWRTDEDPQLSVSYQRAMWREKVLAQASISIPENISFLESIPQKPSHSQAFFRRYPEFEPYAAAPPSWREKYELEIDRLEARIRCMEREKEELELLLEEAMAQAYAGVV